MCMWTYEKLFSLSLFIQIITKSHLAWKIILENIVVWLSVWGFHHWLNIFQQNSFSEHLLDWGIIVSQEAQTLILMNFWCNSQHAFAKPFLLLPSQRLWIFRAWSPTRLGSIPVVHFPLRCGIVVLCTDWFVNLVVLWNQSLEAWERPAAQQKFWTPQEWKLELLFT